MKVWVRPHQQISRAGVQGGRHRHANNNSESTMQSLVAPLHTPDDCVAAGLPVEFAAPRAMCGHRCPEVCFFLIFCLCQWQCRWQPHSLQPHSRGQGYVYGRDGRLARASVRSIHAAVYMDGCTVL
ncbi:unnamed protein product [Vitrella brassicaformis CCMP3155]|uniref:Uncharacterized protein n=1 Tax=Vitrella brassicaformis (strain CCMP3155) TaxID=1169540 RepID=A0A0G4H014_VITBC|nr:unnamed protein product [Vitrella brassicaformis CCMP3155]|eukprot:CEM36709.1 unnamed protein product [Vitrella brassicaformis CCMP3155]